MDQFYSKENEIEKVNKELHQMPYDLYNLLVPKLNEQSDYNKHFMKRIINYNEDFQHLYPDTYHHIQNL